MRWKAHVYLQNAENEIMRSEGTVLKYFHWVAILSSYVSELQKGLLQVLIIQGCGLKYKQRNRQTAWAAEESLHSACLIWRLRLLYLCNSAWHFMPSIKYFVNGTEFNLKKEYVISIMCDCNGQRPGRKTETMLGIQWRGFYIGN